MAEVSPAAIQLSPLIPGSHALERQDDGAFARAVVLAPPGVLERRYVLAQMLRVLEPGAPLIALAPKTRGGARLRAELAAFGCGVDETARRRHRICAAERPDQPMELTEAFAAGGPQRPAALGLWSQPGVFSWDRPDPGSLVLLSHLPAFAGKGADLGCGVGILSNAVLESAAVTGLDVIDIDRRAIEAARRNVLDARARFQWADVRVNGPDAGSCDFIVTNPPFHDGGAEDRGLGEAFLRCARAALKPGGALWMVANRHLPYEAPLAALFSRVRLVEQTGRFKVYEALR